MLRCILPILFTDTCFIFSHFLSQSQHMTFILASCASLPSRNWVPKTWVKRVVEKWALLSQLHERQVGFLLRPRLRNLGPTWRQVLHSTILAEGNGSSLALCCEIYMSVKIKQLIKNQLLFTFFVGNHTDVLMIMPLFWELEDWLCMMHILCIWLNCKGLNSTVRRPIIEIKSLSSVQYTIMMSEPAKLFTQSLTWLL